MKNAYLQSDSADSQDKDLGPNWTQFRGGDGRDLRDGGSKLRPNVWWDPIREAQACVKAVE